MYSPLHLYLLHRPVWLWQRPYSWFKRGDSQIDIRLAYRHGNGWCYSALLEFLCERRRLHISIIYHLLDSRIFLTSSGTFAGSFGLVYRGLAVCSLGKRQSSLETAIEERVLEDLLLREPVTTPVAMGPKGQIFLDPLG